MMRPLKMKFIELTVLKNDIDVILKYLGNKRVIHFPEAQNKGDTPSVSHIRQTIERLRFSANFLGIELKDDCIDDNFSVPPEADELFVEKLFSVIENLKNCQNKAEQELKRIRGTLNEVSAFSELNLPFSEIEQLSFLTLRIGNLDPKGQTELRDSLGDRAVIVPLEGEDRILAACSRKGRFALDSQLKKVSFQPISIPSDFKGIPSEMLKSLEEQAAYFEGEINKINDERKTLAFNSMADIKKLYSLLNTALVIEEIKSQFTVTESLYHFSGWIPQDRISEITQGLLELTSGRVAIKAYSPENVSSVKEGREKVPVHMKHGAFVKGFESIVFSYGAPLYGTIDPTPLVAVFFTLLFGIMFGDVGQGFVLFLIGLIISKNDNLRKKFHKYPVPLICVGCSSMFFGLLFGAVFSNEHLLITPTRIITGAITGKPVDRILAIMPLEELGGSLTKLIYFFGFTIAIGIIFISLGLIINIANRLILKKYQAAFFSKTGLAGLLFFWYALSIALRIIFGGSFAWFDYAGLLIPVLCIFFGPLIWRLIAHEKPVLEHGFMAFFMEGFVEILETVSTYISNTVSFLRVGAFALSHSILSFIVFTFSSLLASSGLTGTISAVFIMILGNVVIIVLEGMIVAIQVIRLQYYEFFNKFFVETGVEFAPFRFNTAK